MHVWMSEGHKSISSRRVCHVLLMDPVPHINKMYGLVSQEEKHRSIQSHERGHHDLSNCMALAVNQDHYKKNFKKEKDKSLCAHCKMIGHTMDKCYKLHGYSPGHKRFKGHANFAESTNQSDLPQQ